MNKAEYIAKGKILRIMSKYLPESVAKSLFDRFLENYQDSELLDLMFVLSDNNIEVNFMLQLFTTTTPTKEQKALAAELMMKYIHERSINEGSFLTIMHELVKLKCNKEELAAFIIDNIYIKKNQNGINLWTYCDWLYSLRVKKYKDDYIRIASDKELGVSRQMLFLLFGAFKDKDYLSVMLDNIDDDDVNGHIISALSKYPDKSLDIYFEPFLNDRRSWVRKIAIKRLKTN